MGRKRSDYLCPECGKTGSFEEKPTSYDKNGYPRRGYRYVRHFYNGKRYACYVEEILRKKENEEYLKQTSISDQEFERMGDFRNDTIPNLAKFNLTPDQLNKLSRVEKEEYLNERDRYISHNNEDKYRNKIHRLELCKLRKLSGIKAKEEELKVSAIKPPPEYWGESNTKGLFLKLSREFNSISKCLSKPFWDDPISRSLQIQISKQFKTFSKYMKKMAKLVYYFRPASKKIDEDMYRNYNKLYEEFVKPICIMLNSIGLQTDPGVTPSNPANIKCDIIKAHINLKCQFELISDVLGMLLTYLKYIVDERYLLPFSRWKKIYGDRYTNYTIRGAAEHNYLLTGEYLTELAPDNKTVINTPIKTTLTAKHVGKMTRIGGPVFHDIVNELRGTKAAIILGLIKGEEKQIQTLHDLILDFIFFERLFS